MHALLSINDHMLFTKCSEIELSRSCHAVSFRNKKSLIYKLGQTVCFSLKPRCSAEMLASVWNSNVMKKNSEDDGDDKRKIAYVFSSYYSIQNVIFDSVYSRVVIVVVVFHEIN